MLPDQDELSESLPLATDDCAAHHSGRFAQDTTSDVIQETLESFGRGRGRGRGHGSRKEKKKK